ncbi:hypothetical protein CsSME_00052530 [Camellia sinensis var. sinensis]
MRFVESNSGGIYLTTKTKIKPKKKTRNKIFIFCLNLCSLVWIIHLLNNLYPLLAYCLVLLTLKCLYVSVIFKVYDSDGNGKVTFNDILEVLQDLTGSFISDEQREVLPLLCLFAFLAHSYILVYFGIVSHS